MIGLDAGGTADEVADDATLGSLCEHPESPKAATAAAALSATDRWRCIHVSQQADAAAPASGSG